MKSIDMDSMADIVFQLRWDSRDASHNECYAARGVNLWRDWLPEKINRALLGRHALDKLTLGFAPDELFGNNGGPIKVDRQRFAMEPKTGRFYPRGRLSGLPGVFPQNMQPLRCTAVNNGHMEVDLSHPLASYALHLTMTIGQVSTKAYERGGSSVDWVGLLTDGPGMQVRWNDTPTEFFSDRSFQRRNDQPDDRFYEKPRLVHHLDHTAEEMVSDLYRRFVKNGSRVLDLMSSWVSHLPEGVATARVSGVGMNRTELEQNEKLNDFLVHDLNVEPRLPYDNTSFDVVLCTVSVEYLIRPVEVFREVSRVLKPGGVFVIVFSNRWFPPKVVSIWEEIHEFERVGLVLEYFMRSGAYENLETYSMRGLPRPKEDKYAAEIPLSDPVYAVWGSRKPD